MSKKIDEGRFDVRAQSLIKAILEMEQAVKAWGGAHDSRSMVNNFNKLKSDIIVAAQQAGVPDRDLKILGIKKGPIGRLRESSGIFRNTWVGVSNAEMIDIVKKNKFKVKKDNKGWIYAFDKKNELVFKYDPEEYNLYTDETLYKLRFPK